MGTQTELLRSERGRFASKGRPPISEAERKRRHRVAFGEVRIILRRDVAERFRAYREQMGASNSTEVLARLMDQAGVP